MKAYMAVVDANGNVYSSVVKTNTPIEMLQHIFISGNSGHFKLDDPTIVPRVQEIKDFWETHHLVDLTVNEVLDQLISLLGVCDDDETEELVLEMMGDGLAEDALSFLATLRKLFNGEVEDLSEMTEVQTFLMAVISLE
jgi:hypothetical protein